MRARLIIKGDRYQAAKAAADRGIGLVFEKQVYGKQAGIDDPNGSQTSTVGLTEASVEQLNQWFTESSDAPFPVGALLLWTPLV